MNYWAGALRIYVYCTCFRMHFFQKPWELQGKKVVSFKKGTKRWNIFYQSADYLQASTNDTKPSRLVAVTLTLQGIHCSKSNPNFRDITWNVEDNMILHEKFSVVSRFPCYPAENLLSLGQFRGCIGWRHVNMVGHETLIWAHTGHILQSWDCYLPNL